MKIKLFATVITAVVVAISAATQAQTPSGTLAKIQQTGQIMLGHRDASIPFSYLDAEQKPIGYAMDLCARIVDAVRAELKMPSVKVAMQNINLGNQIPLLNNGTIDIVCGPVTNTLERQKQVAFSNTIFVSSIRAAARKSENIKRFADLNGKNVALTSASTSVTLLGQREQEQKFETKRLMSPDHAASWLLVTTGRASAFVMDDILLASMVANSAKPDDYVLLDEALRVEPYGLMFRKDDPQFKALVDRTLASLVKSGELQNLYAKWFMSPIPPKNVNLNFPMTQALKDALANPSDKGI
jgi:glutamate/aspartate transport system substrate-binding protein